MRPDYWNEAAAALAASDEVMRDLIARYPGEALERRGEPFMTLARAIVGQQISVKAAQSVWERFVAAAGTATAEAVLQASPEVLRAAGLSQRKTEYLRDLADHFSTGRLDPAAWAAMDDEALIAALTDVRGIGRWTAEMFLIFNQLRPDVWPVDDIGLQRAAATYYFSNEKPLPRTLREFGSRFRPWRSVATWYLWRALDPIPVEY